MKYSECKLEDLKDFHKVLASYDISLKKAHAFLIEKNPFVKNINGQFYLVDCSLVDNLVNL